MVFSTKILDLVSCMCVDETMYGIIVNSMPQILTYFLALKVITNVKMMVEYT